MNILFVHGMGRSSLSWWPTLKRCQQRGFKTFTFDYFVSCQDFSSIVTRLTHCIRRVAMQGDYVVVGHSLGGVLLRAALSKLTEDDLLPRKMFLLGSPVLPSSIAYRLRRNPIFRIATRDCGQLLSSSKRMSTVSKPKVPVIGITGTKGLKGRLSPFGAEPNDGIVSVAETSADWLDKQIFVPVIHTLLPSSKKVLDVIFECIELN